MNIESRNARIAGLSFLISYLGLIVGNIVIAPILSDYLTLAYPNAIQLGIGILLESVNGIAVLVIAVMIFTIIRKYDEGLALAYLGFRAFEGFLSILGSTKLTSIIDLSNAYLQAGSPADSIYEALGTLTLADRHWTMEMLGVFFILGALIFYYQFYRTELIPKYISLWGLVSVLLLIVFNGMMYLGIVLGFEAILVLPLIANEFFVAIWLIVKGVKLPTDNSVAA
jgi:hypothetical protein